MIFVDNLTKAFKGDQEALNQVLQYDLPTKGEHRQKIVEETNRFTILIGLPYEMDSATIQKTKKIIDQLQAMADKLKKMFSEESKENNRLKKTIQDYFECFSERYVKKVQLK